MLRVILLPALAVVGGVGGFFLRRWELATAFEAETGLAIPGAPATLALIVLSVAVAAAFALLCRGKHSQLGGYDDAFAARGSWPYLILTALGAIALLLSGGITLATFFRQELSSLPRFFLALLCLAACVCVLLVAANNFLGRKKGKYSFALLVPAYMCCLWLVTAYLQYAGDPVVLDYVYELFAIIAALLGLYFAAGFAFERAKVWRCAFFCLLSVYFSLVTQADDHELFDTLLLYFVIFYQLATSAVLLYHAFAAKPGPGPDAGDQTQEVPQDV